MQIMITNSFPPIGEAEVEKFEAKIGAALPASYRAFLLRHNGGTPAPKRFSTRDGKVESMVLRWLPLAIPSGDDLINEYDGFTLAKQIPASMISIGQDPADNRILLAISGKFSGSVYYWSWDEEPEPVTCSTKYMRIVADTFDHFLDGLH